MKNNNFPENILETSYSLYSNILLYGFTDYEKCILEDLINNMTLQDKIKKIRANIGIYETDNITDIFGIPYFMAFINFKSMSQEDKYALLDFFRECEEPIPEDLTEEYPFENNINPVIYAVNFENDFKGKISACMKLADNIFDEKENLRLTILSKVKDLEGCGTASSNSNRIYRVLQMYKLLVNKGILNKELVDKMLYPDQVSQRMFYKDISIIKYVENGNLEYDRKYKGYKLKNREGD